MSAACPGRSSTAAPRLWPTEAEVTARWPRGRRTSSLDAYPSKRRAVVALPDEPRALRVELSEPAVVFVDELSGWLYDSVLLHDAFVLTRPDYDYTFNQYFYRRNGRPVRNEHRLRARRVRYESPFLVETVVSVGVALGGLLKTYEWLRDRPERRRIVRAEADKVEEEARTARLTRKHEQIELARLEREEAAMVRPDLRDELVEAVPELEDKPEALPVIERGVARLSASRFDVVRVDLDVPPQQHPRRG
jgi:hypothetical protein